MITMQKCKNQNCNFFCRDEYCPTHNPNLQHRLKQAKKFVPSVEVLEALENARKDEFSDEEMELIEEKFKKIK
jgi:hypothetical protein